MRARHHGNLAELLVLQGGVCQGGSVWASSPWKLEGALSFLSLSEINSPLLRVACLPRARSRGAAVFGEGVGVSLHFYFLKL